MSDEITLTEADLRTISAAMNYAMQDRSGYIDATVGSIPSEAKKAQVLMKKIDRLHKKLFGTPTLYSEILEREKTMDRVSIFDLSKRT